MRPIAGRLAWLGFVGIAGLLSSGCSRTTDQPAADAIAGLAVGDGVVPVEQSANFELVRSIEVVESDSLFISFFGQSAVSLRPWRFHIADNRQQKIISLDSTGRVVSSVGQQGEGPDEFPLPLSGILTQNGKTVALTPRHVIEVKGDGTFGRVHEVATEIGLRTSPMPGSQVVIRRDTVFAAIDDASGNLFAAFDTSLTLIQPFGKLPSLYAPALPSGLRETYLDIVGNHVATSQRLADEVTVFRMRPDAHPAFVSARPASNAYRPASRAFSYESPMQNCLYHEEYTLGIGVFAVSDSAFVFVFRDLLPGSCDRANYVFDYYAVLMDVIGRTYETVALPGPVVARDDLFNLYVLSSDVPDERVIDVVALRSDPRNDSAGN